MRAVSLLRAWIYGIGVFAAVTASLTVAMSIAITGPPTASEMDDLQVFMADAGRRLGVMAERAGAEACVQLPPEVTGPLCPQRAAPAPETAPAADHEAIVIEAYRTENNPANVEPVTDIVAAHEDDTALLGDIAGDPGPQAAPRRIAQPPAHRARAERRVQPQRAAAQPERRAQPQRAAQQRRTPPARTAMQRAVRSPVAVARAPVIAPLESPAARALEDLAASTPEILADEPISEEASHEEESEAQAFEDVWPAADKPAERAAPTDESIEDALPARWEAQHQDPVYDDAYEQASEDEAYEEELERRYAEREARQRYRARMRAYREWRREGW